MGEIDTLLLTLSDHAMVYRVSIVTGGRTAREDVNMSTSIAGVRIPDSAMAQEATLLMRGAQSDLLLHHALRAFVFAALMGDAVRLKCDLELLLVAALFHNAGLGAKYRRSPLRFEVDGANEARAFLQSHAIDARDIELVWTAIALHTTPGIPEHMPPLVALVHAGVQMDLRGARFHAFTKTQRDEIVAAYPREKGFKKMIIEAYARGMQERPDTTFGTVNADVLDRADPNYKRLNFCGLVLGSEWPN
jgi:HD superfamily phosphodiesterase